MRYLKTYSFKLAGALVLPILLFGLIRHQYTSTPQYAFRQYRDALMRGDLAELKRYTSAREFAHWREIRRMRTRQSKTHGLLHPQWRKETRLDLEKWIQQHGTQWSHKDKTHATVKLKYQIQGQSLGVRKFIGIDEEYTLTKTERGWICEYINQKGPL